MKNSKSTSRIALLVTVWYSDWPEFWPNPGPAVCPAGDALERLGYVHLPFLLGSLISQKSGIED